MRPMNCADFLIVRLNSHHMIAVSIVVIDLGMSPTVEPTWWST